MPSDRASFGECLQWLEIGFALAVLAMAPATARGDWREDARQPCAVEADVAREQDYERTRPRPPVTVLVLDVQAVWAVPFVLARLTPAERAAGVIAVVSSGDLHSRHCTACCGGWINVPGGCPVSVERLQAWGREMGRPVICVFVDPSMTPDALAE